MSAHFSARVNEVERSDWRRTVRGFAATGAAWLLALSTVTAWAEAVRCEWMYQSNSRGESGLETLMLASGYAKVRMYKESFEVLDALEQDPPTRDAQASIHLRRGENYFELGELDKAHHYLLLAVESGRLPLYWRSYTRRLLKLLDFERGRFAEGAAYGEQARKDYFAADCTSKDEQLIARLDLALAKYLSHVDRERALHYARGAVATAAPGTLDPADLEWVALLEAGPAPAPLPTIRRPWLEDPPPPASEAEVLRHVTWTKSYRKLILPPPEVLRASPDPTDLSPYWVTVEETINTPPSIEALKLRLPKPTLPPPAVGEAAAQEPSRAAPAEIAASAG